MNFTITEGNETRINVAGRLDFGRAPKLLEALSALKGKDISTIIFECKDLVYISSAGIRAIVFAQQKIAPGMTIVMEDANEEITEVLDMCGLADFIDFTESEV